MIRNGNSFSLFNKHSNGGGGSGNICVSVSRETYLPANIYCAHFSWFFSFETFEFQASPRWILTFSATSSSKCFGSGFVGETSSHFSEIVNTSNWTPICLCTDRPTHFKSPPEIVQHVIEKCWYSKLGSVSLEDPWSCSLYYARLSHRENNQHGDYAVLEPVFVYSQHSSGFLILSAERMLRAFNWRYTWFISYRHISLSPNN